MSGRLRALLPAPLLAILAAGAVLALAWTLALPPLQAPDELTHVLYTQLLVERGQRPVATADEGQRRPSELAPAAEWGALNVLVGDPEARPAWTEIEESRWRQEERMLPDSARSDLGRASPAASNGPLYYAYEAVPYALASGGSFFDRLYAMRLASMVFYLATIALTWALAGELLGAALWPRTLATALVALQPKLSQMGAVVNPDILLAALWTAGIYLALRIAREGPGRGRSEGAVAVCAAAALTHPRGIPLIAVIVGAFALGIWPRLRPRLAGRAGRPVLVGGSILALVLVVLGLSALAPAGTVAGVERPFSLRELGSYLWQFYLPALPFQQAPIGPDDYGWQNAFVEFLWGGFAWQEITYPPIVYTVLGWLSLAGLAGLAAALIVRRDAVRRHWEALAVVVGAVVTLLLSLHVAAYYVILMDPGSPFIVGRYVLPLIGLFGCAAAFVAASLPRRVAPYAAGALLGGALLLQLAGLGITVARFYA